MNKEETYREITQAFEGIIKDGLPWESALVSLLALLKERLPKVSWAGFYRLSGDNLWVGPYQGKLACLSIPIGKGVCGAAAKENAPQIVPDVHAFPGHIACDASSRSEIVIPMHKHGEMIGVLDLDSYDEATFDNTDLVQLTKLLTLLEKLD